MRTSTTSWAASEKRLYVRGFSMASRLVLVNEKGLWSVPKKSASAPHRTGNEVRDRGAIINEQIIPIQDIELNRAVYKFSLAATISSSVLFTGLFGINLSGLPGARSDAAFGCFPPPVRGFWPYPSSTRKGRGCYRSDGAVKLGTPQPFRRNPSA